MAAMGALAVLPLEESQALETCLHKASRKVLQRRWTLTVLDAGHISIVREHAVSWKSWIEREFFIKVCIA